MSQVQILLFLSPVMTNVFFASEDNNVVILSSGDGCFIPLP